MDPTEISGNPRNGIHNVLSGNNVGSKLAILKNCIRDLEQDCQTLRNFIGNVHHEILVTNEKIKSLLEGNQKRLDLLKDLNDKLAISDYKKSCYFDEFMDLIPIGIIKEHYDNENVNLKIKK